MSSFSNLFGLKYPRSKSEKQLASQKTVFGNFSSADNLTMARSPIGYPSTPTPRIGDLEMGREHGSPSQSGRPLMASSLVTPGFDMGHRLYPPSPLVLAAATEYAYPSPLSIKQGGGELLSPRPPYIALSEIGTKWPTLSYGPGIERRPFFDPSFKKKPAESFGEMNDNFSPPEKTDNDSKSRENSFKNVQKFSSAISKLDRRSASPSNFKAAEDDDFPFCHARRIPPPIQSKVQAVSSEMISTSAETRRILNLSPHPAREDGLFEDIDEYEGAEGQFVGDNAQFPTDCKINQADFSNVPEPHQSVYSQGSSGPSQSVWSPKASVGVSPISRLEMYREIDRYDAMFLACSPGGPESPYPPPNRPLPSPPSGSYGRHPISVSTEPQSSNFVGGTRDLLGVQLSPLPFPDPLHISLLGTPESIPDPGLINQVQHLVENSNEDYQDDNSSEGGPASFLKESARYDVPDHNGSQSSVRRGHARQSYVGPSGGQFFIREPNADRDTPEGMMSVQLDGYGKIYIDPNHPSFESSIQEQSLHLCPSRSQNSTFIDKGKGIEKIGSQDATPATLESDNPSGVNRKGRLARVLEAAGIKGNSRLAKAFEDNDRDWETEADGSQAGLNLATKAVTGSSLADNSDIGSLPSTQQVVQHPAHPRYLHTWNLQQDKQSGQRMLIPHYQFPGGQNWFPNCNTLTMPQTLTSPYQHRTPPLSADREIFLTSSPFTLSSPQADTLEASPIAKADQTPSKLSRFWPRNLRFKRTKESKAVSPILPTNTKGQSRNSVLASSNVTIRDDRRDEVVATAFDNGARGHPYSSSSWLSTVDGLTMSERSNVRCGGHEGSFAKMTTLGPMGNVTGTPDGTGAREVGSSLGGSSPPDHFPNPPFELITPRQRCHIARPNSGALYHRRTINVSLELNEFRINKSSIRHHLIISGADTEVGPSKEKIDKLSPDIRKHREDLVQCSLLAAPPTTEPKRLSMPLEFIGTASSSNPTNNKEPASTIAIETGAEVDIAPYAPWNTTALADRHYSPCYRPILEPQPKSPIGIADRSFKPFAYNPTEAPFARLDTPSYDDLDALRGRSTPPRPIGHPGHPQIHHIPCPTARAASPHILQTPRQSPDAIPGRQKELSRVFLAVCCIVPPIAAIYGHGGFDVVTRLLTHGEMDGFRPQEKVLGMWMGWVLTVVGTLIWTFTYI